MSYLNLLQIVARVSSNLGRDLSPWHIINIFYSSLSLQMKMVVKSMCAGTFSDKTTEQAYEYFDYLANLIGDWTCTGTNNVIKSSNFIPTQIVSIKYELIAEDDLNAKLTTLSKQVKALALAKAATSLPKETSIMCALCDTIDHYTDVCPFVVG